MQTLNTFLIAAAIVAAAAGVRADGALDLDHKGDGRRR
jgi:hypothetical protein